MTGFRLEQFSGIAPRYGVRLLPNSAGTVAMNCKLLSGELRGLRAPREVKDLTGLPYTVRRVYRIPYSTGETFEPDANDLWLAFDSIDVDVVRSPLTNDAFSRYYWTGDSIDGNGWPKYNTLARIAAGQPNMRLGVPGPTTAPTVVPQNTGTPDDATRAYLYTFVTSYGEESAPSPPTVVTGDPTSQWDISGIEVSVPAEWSTVDITGVKIYRTVVGQSSASYFYVDEIAFGVATYADNMADDSVALNSLLESTSWQPPPSTLQGLVVMPNGFMVGFSGRDVYFSEPYRPHAWPVDYILSVEYEVVGLAVHGGQIVVLTKSHPYIGSGVNPAAVSLVKLNSVEPCLCKRSIATTLEGVFYASPNGIIRVNQSGVSPVSYNLVTKEEWVRRFNPTRIVAGALGLQYVAFNSETTGFVYSPADQMSNLIELDRFDNITAVDSDSYSGELYIVKADKVMVWDPPTSEPLYYTWKSKEFFTPKPVNFGAVKIKFNDVGEDISVDTTSYYQPFNTARITESLSAIGDYPIGGVRTMNIVGWTEPQTRNPIGGSPLYPLQLLLTTVPGVRLTVWADREIVYTNVVYNEYLVRLPTGFKADIWQFEMTSNSDLYSFHIAETSKELANI